MPEITTLFFDVGGVLASNGWDRDTRRETAATFGLDLNELEDRHEPLVSSFEKGRLSLDDYLDRVIFFRPRPFSLEEFKRFLYAQSQPKPDSLALARGLAAKYRLATINNESLELNRYRIDTFGLREIFIAFFSSCYVDLRKPDPAIYRMALDVMQKPGNESCFIDDRELNLDGAHQAGMHAVHFKSAEQLERELAQMGVTIARAVPTA